MKKDVKYLSIEKLQAYIELLQRMAYDIQDVGVKVSLAHNRGGLTEEKKNELHLALYNRIKLIDARLLDCMTELNKRLKADLALPYGFKEVTDFLESFKKTDPDIFLTDEEFNFKKKEEERLKALKETVDAADIDIPQRPEPMKVVGKKVVKE